MHDTSSNAHVLTWSSLTADQQHVLVLELTRLGAVLGGLRTLVLFPSRSRAAGLTVTLTGALERLGRLLDVPASMQGRAPVWSLIHTTLNDVIVGEGVASSEIVAAVRLASLAAFGWIIENANKHAPSAEDHLLCARADWLLELSDELTAGPLSEDSRALVVTLRDDAAERSRKGPDHAQ